LYYKIEYFFSC